MKDHPPKRRQLMNTTKRLWSSARSFMTPSDMHSKKSNVLNEDCGKKVKFAPTTKVKRIPCHHSLSSDDRAQIWYTADEMLDMKYDARIAAVQAASSSKESAEIITNAFKSAWVLSATKNELEMEELLADQGVMYQHAADLSRVFRRDEHMHRGLEEYFSSRCRAQRKLASRESRKEVVQSTCSSDHVAEHYRRMAISSVLLARFFASADAHVATTLDSTRKDDAIPEQTVSSTSMQRESGGSDVRVPNLREIWRDTGRRDSLCMWRSKQCASSVHGKDTGILQQPEKVAWSSKGRATLEHLNSGVAQVQYAVQ